ncbi:MAG: hypothetical protein WD512_19575 [Candidatus Paceibacterota bacterium]
MLTVIYRTGGTTNFKWKKIASNYERVDQTSKIVEAINRFGYKNLIVHVENVDKPRCYQGFYL